MKTYGSKILQQQRRLLKASSVELRDGIIISVNETSSYCVVNVQNSNEDIIAWYNTNYEAKPNWMKPGNAIRISMPGGAGGKVQVVSHGFKIPTRESGGSVKPPGAVGPDIILEGLIMTAPGLGMTVDVSGGRYRINDITYVWSPIEMDDATMEMDNSAFDMGLSFLSGNVVFGAAHATREFRIDIVVIGIDGVLDVVAGTPVDPFDGDPVAPDIPTDHVLIGSVLIPPQIGVILQTDINKPFIPLKINGIGTEGLSQGYGYNPNTYIEFEVGFIDQYGNFADMDWEIELEVIGGGGEFFYGESDIEQQTRGSMVISHTKAIGYGYDPLEQVAYRIDSLADSPTFILRGLGDYTRWVMTFNIPIYVAGEPVDASRFITLLAQGKAGVILQVDIPYPNLP